MYKGKIISVAMATFNGEKYILEQLNSILKQSVHPDEVIISDDGSTDNTLAITRGFIEHNELTSWKLVINNKEHGVSNNYINSISYCTGDLIFLCDQDDIWADNKVECMVNAFTDDGVKCVISAIRYIDSKGIEYKDRTAYTDSINHSIDLAELCSVCSYLGMASAFSKDVVASTSTNFMLKTTHDWALMVRASEIGRISYIGDKLQSYRQHGSNASVISEGSRKEKRLGLIRRQIEMQESTIDYCAQENSMKIIRAYLQLNEKRYTWIANKRVLSIAINYSSYRKMKFSNRNIIADLCSAL